MRNSETIEAIIALAPNLVSRESLEKKPHEVLSEMLDDIRTADMACRAGRRLADVFDQDISLTLLAPRSVK